MTEEQRQRLEEIGGHTPGPWGIKEVKTSAGSKGRAFKINEPGKIEEGHGLIACIYDDSTLLNERPHAEHEANAKLIAAAPELLSLVREQEKEIENCHLSAVASARGEQHERKRARTALELLNKAEARVMQLDKRLAKQEEEKE